MHNKLLLNRPSTICGRSKRPVMHFVYSLMLTASLLVGIVSLNLVFSSQAYAFNVFAWFTDSDEKSNDDLLNEDTDAHIIVSQAGKHKAIFGELVYYYFQQDYQKVLLLVEVGNAKHGFSELSQDDTDRLNLIQGAAQLKVGLYTQSQAKFASLLSQTTSDYVQANTWFYMAKAAFENKQAYLTEQAYAAILKENLRDTLSNEQWYDLLYLTGYTRMQKGQDWQALFAQIPSNSIYSAYLLANQASLLFNKAEYEKATATFIEAKQALIEYKNRRGRFSQIASSAFDTATWVLSPWRWFDSNANAEQAAIERKMSQSVEEQNALFDRINIGLGQSLLQQGDLGNATAVIATIADAGTESEQALLTYGWANAKENRWQTAMAAWQHLQQSSKGLYSLQASYGLAYAFSQQDNLGQAFYALQTTTNQIDKNLIALEAFASNVQKDSFFTNYDTKWPEALDDLKLGFFAPSAAFNATHLLTVRQQSKEMLADIEDKHARALQLEELIEERKVSYNKRLQGMQLEDAKNRIDNAQKHINDLNTLIIESTTFEKQLALSKQMSSDDINNHITRLDSANQKHARLAADTNRKRPLKTSYKDRLDLIEGILTWQLMDNFVAQKWQHQKLLGQAQDALQGAKLQYQKLLSITQNHDAVAIQRVQLKELKQSLNKQVKAANNVFERSSNTLKRRLLSIIDERKSQLQEQGVNTRLAMLRIQDLQQQGGQ